MSDLDKRETESDIEEVSFELLNDTRNETLLMGPHKAACCDSDCLGIFACCNASCNCIFYG